MLGRQPAIADAEFAWWSLTEACHHRAYDVGLTESELRAHLGSARAFLVLVADRVRASAARTAGAGRQA